VAVAADASALAVIGHQDHGGVVESPALVQEGEEVADLAIGLGELVEVLGAADAAHVAELVASEQLEDEQVGVLLLHHPAGLGTQRVVDPGGGLDRGDRANHLPAKRIDQMGDPHEPAAPAVALEHVEGRLDPDPQPGREVRAHPVLGGRGAGEHRREADDRAGGVGRLDREVLGSLTGEAVDRRRFGLPQPPAVAAVDDDHVNPLGPRGSTRLRKMRPVS